LAAAEGDVPVRITECLARNERGWTDEDGERPGWIELHNPTPRTVHLLGFWLTDDPARPARWRLPDVALLADQYLVIAASGKDRTNAAARLHTNFRLGKGTRRVALANRATNVISLLELGRPEADVSVGRVLGDPDWVGAWARPTPGRPNTGSGRGFAPPVTFSVPPGPFEQPLTVALAAPGATIHFTRDGTLPTTNDPAYTAPLRLTNSTLLRVRAYQDGRLPGPPATAAYPAVDTNAAAFSSPLPLLVLDTLGQRQVVSARQHFVHVSVQVPEGGRSRLTHEPALALRAGIRQRGSTSGGMPQPGFALEFLDEFNQERAAALLGLPADSDWILYAPNAYDPVLIHNPFIHELSRELGRYSPRTRFVEVFVKHDGGPLGRRHYAGLYVLMEKIRIGPQRVDIDRLGPEDLAPPAVTGGYLLKFDRLGPGEEGLDVQGDRGIVFVEPREEVLRLPQRRGQREYIEDYLAEFHRVLEGPQWRDRDRGYRAYLDVEAAIDFHVLEVLSGNVDAMVLSTYFHKPRGGRITCGPHWDFDRALGSLDERDANPRRWSTGPFFGGKWWPRLFSDPDFWQLWVDRWQGLRRAQFSLAHLHGLMDRLTGEIAEAQPRQYSRWGLQARGGSYDGEIRHMKDWISNRVDFIDGQLVAPPRVEERARPGGGREVVLGGPGPGAVYCTLDGSDPRRPGGGIAPQAFRYTNPVPVSAQTVLTARSHHPDATQTDGPPISTPWSGPVRVGGGAAR
jgi:hypothetical protein